MAVTIKSQHEIELMRESCKILAEVHAKLGEMIEPGISTWDIDAMGEKLIRSYGCVPNFLNYNGYPASICVSVNDEVVHGIPSKERILMEGDIVSLDAGLIYKGYHSDAARTYPVGEVSQDAYCSKFGYGVVRDLVGHGIGTSLHEDPQIPNFRQWRKGIRLQPGMTLAIEPMITLGTYKVGWLDDDWTVVTMDGSPAAHYENTILITEGEPEILTLLPGGEGKDEAIG